VLQLALQWYGRFDTEEIARWRQAGGGGMLLWGPERRVGKGRVKQGADAWLTTEGCYRNLLLVGYGRLPDEPQLIVRLLWLEE